MTLSTSPDLPLSLPVSTTTRSPFLIFDAITDTSGASETIFIWFLVRKLTGHRAKYTRADRLALLVDQNRGVAVEANGAAVRTPMSLAVRTTTALHHVALLDASARDRLFDD